MWQFSALGFFWWKVPISFEARGLLHLRRSRGWRDSCRSSPKWSDVADKNLPNKLDRNERISRRSRPDLSRRFCRRPGSGSEPRRWRKGRIDRRRRRRKRRRQCRLEGRPSRWCRQGSGLHSSKPILKTNKIVCTKEL